MKNEVCLGEVAAIPLGEGRAFVVDGQTLAVFRTRDGRLFATQNRCPHANGPLADGFLGATNIICPLHAYKFNLATGACLTDPSYRVRTYPVREENGQVFVTLA